jgi:hypothetical protein
VSFFAKWIDAWSVRNRALIRIADALDRIAPAIEEEPADIRPDDAVTYVDEQKMARQDEIDQAGELARWLEDHPEWAEAGEEAKDA